MFNRYWDATRDEFSDRTNVAFLDEYLPYISKHCNNIVDLGCGTGRLVKRLNDEGLNCLGITYNQDEVSSRLHEKVHHGDMQDLYIDSGTKDGFIMWDSLEHCQSAYVALCEAKRILKDFGRGLIFMPGQNWLDCKYHICCYTVPQMIQLLKQAGLKCVTCYIKAYANEPSKYCEGMAVYEVENLPGYKGEFKL